ncbi:G5 domain-containing protein [Actinoplanes sp. NPDC051633]|uniref:G5 domain-containing protein n=1 Tax=Actinoplanes sp. NPDC051633 TaxID=3155670 RepID=UPI00341ADC20
MTVGASAVLVLIGGGTAAVAAITDDDTRIVRSVGQDQQVAAAPPAPAGAAAGVTGGATGGATGGGAQGRTPSADAQLGGQSGVAEQRVAEEADRTAPRTPRKELVEQPPQVAATRVPAAKPAMPAQPAVTTRTETETRTIPFRTRLVRDPALPRGRKRIQTEGVPGEEVLRYAVTVTNGQPTDRRLVDSTVTRQPQHRVVAFGTGRGGGWGCRPDHGCRPGGRAAGCAQPESAQPESAALPLGGTVALLDEDLAVLDDLELQQGMLC